MTRKLDADNIMELENHDPKKKIVSDLKEVMSGAESLIKATAGDVTDKVKEVRAQLSESLARTKVKVHDIEEIVKDKAVTSAKETDRVIRDHPYESIGVAFGVGLLIGILINRK